MNNLGKLMLLSLAAGVIPRNLRTFAAPKLLSSKDSERLKAAEAKRERKRLKLAALTSKT